MKLVSTMISAISRPLRLAVCFVAILLTFNTVRAQVEATLEQQELLMGQTVKLTLAVKLPTDTAAVSFPMLEQAIRDKRTFVPLLNDTIELLVKHTVANIERDGANWRAYNLALQAFDSGRYVLPPFELMVEGKPETSNSLTLEVIPVKVKADDQLDPFSDILPPFEVNPDPEALEEETEEGLLIWWLIAAAFLLLVIIGYLFYRFRQTGKFLPFGKPVPPYQQALSKLKKLQQQNLPQKGKTKEYYTRLTDILRKYLNRQFEVKTIEKTSKEILIEISADDRIEKYEGLLKSIFETADFVKFAKVNPSVVENGRCMTDAIRFVNATRPQDKEDGSNKKKGR